MDLETSEAADAVVTAPATLSANIADFLRWLDARPRTYRETMEAWRTSCPRLSCWEDALDLGLITLDGASAATQGETGIRLTGAGRRLLAASRA